MGQMGATFLLSWEKGERATVGLEKEAEAQAAPSTAFLAPGPRLLGPERQTLPEVQSCRGWGEGPPWPLIPSHP